MQAIVRLAESKWFGGIVLAVIVLNGVLVGWQTYDMENTFIKHALNVCLGIFVIELVVKLLAAMHTRTLGAFFKDGWNIFDVVVVVGSFLPAADPTMTALVRVIRVLRVFRLVRSVPELRLIVTVLVKSVVSMKYITLLAGIILFIYGVIGVKLFGQYMPKEYGSLHESFFTLFRVLTGDNWSDLRYAAEGQSWQWKNTFYHVSWIIVSTFLLINLIVGAVLNNYQEVQEAERNRARKLDTSDERLAELAEEMQAILKVRGAKGTKGGGA
ncbi:MAG: ion transporter [Phycisphaerae bacterium]|jgi:voltage-gated sodium channel